MAGEEPTALTVTANGNEMVLVYGNLSLGEKRACKIETGLSLEAWMADVSDVTVCVLWWLARRANGEPRLPYLIAEPEFEKLDTIAVDFGGEDDDLPES